MATTVADLPELLKGVPPGAWVAISERQNRALAYGVDPQAVFYEAQQKGEEQPLMVRVPEENMAMFLPEKDAISAQINEGIEQARRGELINVDDAIRMLQELHAKRRIA